MHTVSTWRLLEEIVLYGLFRSPLGPYVYVVIYDSPFHEEHQTSGFVCGTDNFLWVESSCKALGSAVVFLQTIMKNVRRMCFVSERNLFLFLWWIFNFGFDFGHVVAFGFFGFLFLSLCLFVRVDDFGTVQVCNRLPSIVFPINCICLYYKTTL